MSSDKESGPASRGVTPSSVPGANPFEGVKAAQEEEEGEEGFVDPQLPYQAAEDGKEGDLFNVFPSRANEALKTRELPNRTSLLGPMRSFADRLVVCVAVAALKQALVTQLMSQEAAEQTKPSSGGRLLRTTSLRTPIDSHARVLVHNGSDKSGAQTDDPSQDLGSGDTGFFDSPEDYG